MAKKQIQYKSWFAVPHVIFEMTDLSVYEKWVLLYIIRHTHGFHEYGDTIYKRISVDEFMNGRKRQDGSRMDSGCGISRGAVSNAVNALVAAGYLRVQIDDSDPARVKKSYSLVLSPNNEGSSDEPSVHQVNSQGSSDEPVHRKKHKKETIERKKRSAPDKSDAPAPAAQNSDASDSTQKKSDSKDSRDEAPETNWERAAAFAHYFILERDGVFSGADTVPDAQVKRGLVIEKLIREDYKPLVTIAEIRKFAEFVRATRDYTVKGGGKVQAEFDVWRRSDSYQAYIYQSNYQARQAERKQRGDTPADDNPPAERSVDALLEPLIEHHNSIQDSILGDSDD